MKKAFTLIELLVVISIIALLLSVLVPSLGRAKEVARRSICGSNLKSLGQGVYAYAINNDGVLPESFYEAGSSVEYEDMPFFTYYLFTITSDPSFSGKERVRRIFGLGHLYMNDLIETGESFYCPSTPKVGEAIKHRYGYYNKAGDFPWNNDRDPWNISVVRSSYNYVPQASGKKVSISTDSGSGMFPATANRISELRSTDAMTTDILMSLDRLPHKKGSGKRAGGVNALFSDGSVRFCNNYEAFTEELWQGDRPIGNDEYIFRTILSKLR